MENYVIEQREFQRGIRTRYYVEASTGGEHECKTLDAAKKLVDEWSKSDDETKFVICINGDTAKPFYTIVYREYDKENNLLSETKIADTDINLTGIEIAQTYAEDIMKSKEKLADYSRFGLINHRRNDSFMEKCLFRGWYLLQHC